MSEAIKFEKLRKAYLFVVVPSLIVLFISCLSVVYYLVSYDLGISFDYMNPVVSFCYILYSASLLLIHSKSSNNWIFYIAKVLSLMLFGFSLLTSLEFIFYLDTKIVGYFLEGFPQLASLYNSQISFELGIVFLLLSLSLLLNSYRPNMNKLSLALNVVVLIVSLVSVNGYFFDVPEFYSIKSIDSFEMYSAVCALLLSLSGLFLRPIISYFSILMSNSSSGAFARRVSIACLLLPPALGKFGQYLFFFGMPSSFAFGIVAVLSLVFMIAVVWKSSTALELVDRYRLGSEQERTKFLSQREALLSEAPIGISFFNFDGSLIRANNIFNSLFLKNVSNLYEIEAFKTKLPLEAKSKTIDFAGNSNFIFELELKDNDHIKYLSLNIFKIKSEDGLYSAIGCSCVEITHLKEIERQLIEARDLADSSNKAKSQFLANMSHEIRTPISVIMGFVDLIDNNLTKTNADTESIGFVEIIKKNCRHLLNIIDDILDLSRVEAGKFKIHYEDISPKDLMEDLKATLEIKKRENISLDFTIDPSVPAIIVSDNSRIRQVVLNLCNNAIKFTKQGTVRLSCYYQDRKLFFKVEDQGCGIPESEKEKLFKPFSQVDSSETREFGGNGLGLALSQKFAKLLGGDIYIEKTVVDQGSTFVAFFLDHSQSIEAQNLLDRQKEMKLVAEKTVKESQKKILVVDDSPDNRVLISHMLKSCGYLVQTAKDGGEGFNYALNEEYDLILMDLQMPVMGGYEATKKLREHGYKKPIVALTAHAMNGIKEKCLEHGFTNYLTKPINKKKLLEVAEYY